jgi:hypothetical protein
VERERKRRRDEGQEGKEEVQMGWWSVGLAVRRTRTKKETPRFGQRTTNTRRIILEE